MKRRYFLLVVLISFAGLSAAQDNKIVAHFVDTVRSISLKNVILINRNGVEIARSDSSGYAVLQLSYFDSSKYIIAFCLGYKPDTIYTPFTTIFMQPLTAELQEELVTGKIIQKILHEPREYVVDYGFDGDNIFVLTYSGHAGGQAKIYFINKTGELLSANKIPSHPVGFYRSCVGKYYCIYSSDFYPLCVTDSTVTLMNPYDIKILPGMQQCNCSVAGNLYYKLTDRQNFKVVYGMIKKGETSFCHLADFEEKDVAEASFNEWMDILALLDHAQFNEAARRQSLRLMWDKGSLSHINMPLIAVNDTLVIFDFFNKKLLLYNVLGIPLKQIPIHFAWKESQQFEIIKDERTNKVYIHRFDNLAAQTVEEIEINTATIVNKIAVGRPFAEQLQIYNGKIYFLWQDKSTPATRQLFVQMGPM